ncbi:Clp protease N-terminal domain-containing protein [Kineococcus sp. SYSU DK018]|uniref:Clp protease N-terminal domain-containing protein n=1 Tax=Kineococcus sp. SYSU DK018 TaxID=3383139 RepID=UPI003D7D4217
MPTYETPIHDQSFGAVMVASQREATRLRAPEYGSEHVLLGLLSLGGPIVDAAVAAFPGFTLATVRTAVETDLDDRPHLERLGISSADVPAAPDPVGALTPANRHTAEWQSALASASVKLNQLQKSRLLPRERKVSAALLWLAVLEPAARASKLLRAMAVDPDRVRDVVLRDLAPAGSPLPAWPTQARPGLVTRLVQHAFTRINVRA